MAGEKEKKPTYISAAEAVKIADAAGIEVTYQTILHWVERHKLGFQPGGSSSIWYIDKDKFEKHLNNG